MKTQRESHLSIFTASEQAEIRNCALELGCNPEDLARWIWEDE